MIVDRAGARRKELPHRLNIFNPRSNGRSNWSVRAPLQVVVIGAGIGGLATAARLAQAGFRVVVLEKNSKAGGRVHQYARAGYVFDTGATMFLMPKIFEQTYAELGEQLHDHLDLIRVDPSCRIHYGDGSRLDLTGDMAYLQEQLEAYEPGSFAQALRYLAEGSDAMDEGMEEFVGRDFQSLFDYFSPLNLPLLLKLKAHIKHFDNVSRYFKNENLRRAFSFQNMYLGLSPFDAPATYSVLQFTEMAEGVYLPRGGMSAVIDSLVKIGKRFGVRYYFDTPVSAINVSGSRTSGVTLESGMKLQADIVIANADLPYVYDELLPDEREAARLKKLKYTCSELIFIWGLKKKIPQLLHHNIFLAGDYRASFDRVFKDLTLPDDPSFYLNVPSRTDPSMAPGGKDGLMAMVPVGHLDEDNPQDWDEIRDRARQVIFERLDAIGIKDLRDQISFEVTFGPPQYRSHLNLMKGAAFGLGYNFSQIGYLRPHNQHRHYRNLYFVGASTHPGGGLPIVLISSKLVTQRIMQDFSGVRQHAPLQAHVHVA